MPNSPSPQPPQAQGEVAVVESHQTIFPLRDLGNYMLSYSEMRHVKNLVRSIRDKVEWPRVLGTGLLFLAPAFLLAWLQWGAAFDALSPAGQSKYAGISVLLLGSVVFCLLGAAVCFASNGEINKNLEVDKQHVIDYLETIEEKFAVQPPDEAR